MRDSLRDGAERPDAVQPATADHEQIGVHRRLNESAHRLVHVLEALERGIEPLSEVVGDGVGHR